MSVQLHEHSLCIILSDCHHQPKKKEEGKKITWKQNNVNNVATALVTHPAI